MEDDFDAKATFTKMKKFTIQITKEILRRIKELCCDKEGYNVVGWGDQDNGKEK